MNISLITHFAIRTVQSAIHKTVQHFRLLTATSLLLVTFHVFGEPFVVNGTMRTSLPYLNKSAARECKFTVTVDDCRFIINTEDTSPASNQTGPIPSSKLPTLPQGAKIVQTIKWSWAYDGVDTYVVFGSKDGWSSAQILPGLSIQTSVSSEEILWLAFASKCYLSSLTNSTMQPLWPLDDASLEKTNYRMSVIIKTFNDQLGLLQNIAYLNDGLYRGFDHNRGSYIEPLADPYSKGYTNALYEVQQLTNSPFGILPLDSVFTRYAVPLGYSGPILTISKTEILVSNIEIPKVNVAFLPTVDQISVVDFRLAGNVPIAGNIKVPYDYIRYRVTNGQWLSASSQMDVRQQYETGVKNQFAKEKKSIVTATHDKTKRSVASILIIGFILCSAIVTMLMAWSLHKKRNDHINNQ